MGSIIGSYKVCAQKAGIPYEEYIIKIKTEKWCYKCKQWRNRCEFNIDNNRGDKLCSKCHDCIRVKVKKSTKGRISWFKGKHHSKKMKKYLSTLKKGKPSPRKNFKHTLETRKIISEIIRQIAPRGKDNPNFKDGKTAERRGIRFSAEYARWRYDVFSRDKFTCQKCGDNKGGNLQAHHIKSFADFPELRLEISNGLTLCEICHKTEHAK